MHYFTDAAPLSLIQYKWKWFGSSSSSDSVTNATGK